MTRHLLRWKRALRKGTPATPHILAVSEDAAVDPPVVVKAIAWVGFLLALAGEGWLGLRLVIP